METPLVLVPWLILAIPVVSMVKWSELSKKKRNDYAHFVEWKEFHLWRIAAGKLVFFGLVGFGSIVFSVTPDRTMLALPIVGACGYWIEWSIASERPRPTPGYRMGERMCRNCSLSDHEGCTNLRMLDGFESEYRGTGGYNRPVCCCGFRLKKWEEAQV
jgi:hypothetical protein